MQVRNRIIKHHENGVMKNFMSSRQIFKIFIMQFLVIWIYEIIYPSLLLFNQLVVFNKTFNNTLLF